MQTLTPNAEIKREMRGLLVPAWAIAAEIGVHENTVLRRLRTELSENDTKKYMEIIHRIAENRAAV